MLYHSIYPCSLFCICAIRRQPTLLRKENVVALTGHTSSVLRFQYPKLIKGLRSETSFESRSFCIQNSFSKKIVLNSQSTKAHLTCNVTEVFTSFLTTVSWSKMHFKFQPRIPKADFSLNDFGWRGGEERTTKKNWDDQGVTTFENKGAITM